MEPKKMADSGALNHNSGTFDHEIGALNHSSGTFDHEIGALNHSSGTFDHDLGVAAARGKDQSAVVYHSFSMGAGRVEDLLGVLPPANDPGAFNHSSGTFAHKPDMAAARGKDHSPVDNNPAMHRVFDHDHLGVAAAGGKDQGAVVYHISSLGAGRVEDLLGVPPPADDPGAFNYSSGTFAHQPDMGAGRGVDLLGVLPPTKDPGAFNYNSFRRFLPAMGMVATSSAITGLAAGTPTPAAGFGLFVLLLVGLSLVTLRVLGA